MKIRSVLNAILVLFVVAAVPLAAKTSSNREGFLVNRFEKSKKVYVMLDQGLCFEIVCDGWKSETWLPGDPIKVERLYGYSSFDFRLENTVTSQCVYAKYAYIEEDDQGYHVLKRRVDALEKRIAYLEDFFF